MRGITDVNEVHVGRRAGRAVLMAFPLASLAARRSPPPPSSAPSRDSSGAALPGATVTARNVDTGFTHTCTSNEAGAYRLEFLPIGSYVVEVTLARVQDREPQRHRPATSTTRPASMSSLELGGVTETVTVEAAAPARQHGDLRHLEDHRRRGDPEPAARRPQRLHAAGPDAGRAVQQQRRRHRLGRHQLAHPRLPRAAHADQRRRRRRHRLGELLPRWRHQHDGVAQHRQHPAQPGRHPGVQGPDQQLQRGVRPLLERRHQRAHQVRHQQLQGLARSSTCATAT